MVRCRNCGNGDSLPLIDLGSAPLSNAYLTADTLRAPESWFPLQVRVCNRCWLAQTEDYLDSSEIFTDDYAYFSSASSSWLKHAERFVADASRRLNLSSSSFVVEIAANDGYLLQYVQARGIPCLGIEPTASTAAAGRARGLEMAEVFLGVDTAKTVLSTYGPADLVVANNVLAHVPNLDDFVVGMRELLDANGVVSIEFPTITSLVDGGQFDTIYHEHYSYLSLHSVTSILQTRGLTVFDVEPIPTHGGSLRVFAQRTDTGRRPTATSVHEYSAFETERGVLTPTYYSGLQAQAETVKNDLVNFLIDCRRTGLRVGGYGAAAKGNTLLNFSGIRPDLLPYVVDRSPSKAGKFLPGSRIPIVDEESLRADRPDFILLLPWNIKAEVAAQLSYTSEWGGRIVTAVPELRTY